MPKPKTKPKKRKPVPFTMRRQKQPPKKPAPDVITDEDVFGGDQPDGVVHG